jgi:CheY-like chemotaxis protein
MKILDILLVEDSEGDIRLVREAFREARVLNNISVVRNGAEAMDYLLRRNGHGKAVTPDLILLDLNLPKKNGREVLAEIKGDGLLRHIPVVILTTSNSEADVMESYSMHANCYIVKPLDINQFIDVVKSIENFWFTVVKLPAGEEKYG